MGGAIGVAPEAFGLGGFQRPFGHLGSELLQRPGGGAGEGREPRRQRLFQFGLHVDVGEELIGQVVGELGLISSFCSSLSLVLTQLSVLSAWRLTQIEKIARKAIRVATTSSAATMRAVA